MTYKNTIMSLLLMIAVGFTIWTTLVSYDQQTLPQVAKMMQPDAFMEDVVAVVMDKFGKPSMKIVTPKMIHYAENDLTDLTAPQLTLYRKSVEPWYITAKFAKATQGVDNVDFRDEVIIHHAADENNPATLIKTNTLTVHPNQKIADTNDVITMTQPNLVVKATGMHADMNTGDIKLLSQARGEYVSDS